MANKPIAVEAESDHEETYDEWFRRQVQKALDEADRPDAVWYSHEEVMRDWEQQHADILATIKKK
jgi:hypothetical protein